jgi:hypothetical protein
MVKVTHGTKALIGERMVRFGSVHGYERESLQVYREGTARRAKQAGLDVVTYTESRVAAAISHSVALREKLFWINLESSVLSDDRRAREQMAAEREAAVKLDVGQIVDFDGYQFEIAPAHNSNFDLKRVGE